MIQFLSIDTPVPFDNFEEVRGWVERVIQSFGKKTGEVFFLFCSDQFLFEMNLKHLEHDTFTDIITFDLSESNDFIGGEMYVSVDRILENSKLLGIASIEEIHRVMIHGVLHLLGYKDKTKTDEAEMRRQENYCLSLRS
jgi:probable rRNA maturation factor